MVRSVIEQDEFDFKMKRRGPGGGREGSEEADTMVQEKEDEAWAGAAMKQRWRSVTDHSPPSTQSPLPCSFSVLSNMPYMNLIVLVVICSPPLQCKLRKGKDFVCFVHCCQQ